MNRLPHPLIVVTSGTLLFIVIIMTLVALCSCSHSPVDGPSMESWLHELGVKYQSESRLAIPTVRNKDKRGRYTIPNCPLCGAHPIDIWTGYHCGKHRFETPSIPLD